MMDLKAVLDTKIAQDAPHRWMLDFGDLLDELDSRINDFGLVLEKGRQRRTLI